MSPIVGIDLGTTNSVVAVLENGQPRVITNEEGGRLTSSVVAVTAGGEVLVGELARRQAVTNAEATIYSVKRFMGRRYSEVEEEAARVSYQVVEADNGDAVIQVRDRRWSPPEVSARILQKLKRAAELHLGEPVTDAVITVPAYFNDAQRKATRDAGEIAGFNVRRIINEPTAAALCYGLDSKKEELIAVYDFGGGTFDVSILEVAEDVVEVLSTAGDTHLGGDDIDAILVKHLLDVFQGETGLDVSADPMVSQRLREAAEKAKVELSSILETEINLPFLTADASGPKHLTCRITRATLERYLAPLVERTIDACRRALIDADRKREDVHQVVLVGGSTRIPLVQKEVTEYFGREPHRGLNPDEVVALGAAIQAAVLTGALDNVLLLDVVPLSLGVETAGGIMAKVLPRNTTVPTRRTKIFSTVTDNQSTVEIHVCQGEREFVADNRSLGRFELGDIPDAPRATPQIEVAFDVDANSILTVTAVEKTTGKKAEITIRDAGGLSQDDVRRAMQDAEREAASDKQRRKRVELRNRLQSLIHSTQRQLLDLHDELDGSQRARVESTLLNARDVDGADDATTELYEETVTGMSALAKELNEIAYAREHAQQEAARAAAEAQQAASEQPDDQQAASDQPDDQQPDDGAPESED